MINMKKKNRILIAGLMAIAVTGGSTYAYFTSQNDLSGNSGANNPLELQITNGKVEVTGVIGDGQAATPNWTYDVARDSTEGYKDKLGQVGNIVAGITTTNNRETDITSYENKHRSPDIEGLDSTDKLPEGSPDGIPDEKEDVSGVKRWKIGTAVTGAISKARPGDAFVLGGSATQIDKKGLVVTNNSNLTVKVNVGIKSGATTGSGADEYVTVVKALQDAGWKLYINDGEITDAKKTTIETALGASSLVLSPNATNTIKIRLEFPLTQGDTYQNDGGSGHNGTISSFDISGLFEIKATQENNPGWTN